MISIEIIEESVKPTKKLLSELQTVKKYDEFEKVECVQEDTNKHDFLPDGKSQNIKDYGKLEEQEEKKIKEVIPEIEEPIRKPHQTRGKYQHILFYYEISPFCKNQIHVW